MVAAGTNVTRHEMLFGCIVVSSGGTTRQKTLSTSQVGAT